MIRGAQPPGLSILAPMRFQPARNSLFAILLRSRWWISFVVAGAVVAGARALLPSDWFVVGAVGALPFAVIGCIAAWRQWRAPDPKRVEEALQALRAMPWSAFSGAIEQAFRRDGHAVAVITGEAAADYELTRNGQVSLVACKRWKAARVGIEPLRELRAAQQRRKADACIYVTTGELTETARSFAEGNGVHLLQGAELAALLPVSAPARAARG